MRYSLFICLLLVITTNGFSQVKIGGTPTSAHESAVLELDGGNKKGLLLPRMEVMDIYNIVDPAEGLLIFCTTDNTVYSRSGGFWKRLAITDAGFYLPYSGTGLSNGNLFEIIQTAQGSTAIYGRATINGTGVHGYTVGSGTGIKGFSVSGYGGYFNSRFGKALVTDTGRIGFGVMEPDAYVHIDATKSDFQTMLLNDESPMIGLQAAGVNKGFMQVTGDDIKLGTFATNDRGRFYVRTNGADRLMIDSSGRVGLNTGSDVKGTFHIKANTPQAATFVIEDAIPSIAFRENDGTAARIRFHTGALKLESFIAADLGMYTNGLQRMNIDGTNGNTFMTGNLSVGNSVASSTARLYVNSENSGATAIVVNDVNPTLQFQNSGVDKGALQLNGDDFRLGTNFSNTEGKVILRSGGLDRVFLDNAGTFSIGSNTPVASKLYVNAVGNASTAVVINDENPTVQLQNSGVDKGALQLNGDDIRLGTNFANTAGKVILRSGGVDRVYLDNNGNISIGTETVATGYRVTVKGKLMAEEMRVQAQANWPDYVFNHHYKLLSLESLESFINTHHHLPNIPAADIVQKEGIAVGDMQTRMMEKIEELTLYLIQANKEIKELRASLQQLYTAKHRTLITKRNRQTIY